LEEKLTAVKEELQNKYLEKGDLEKSRGTEVSIQREPIMVMVVVVVVVVVVLWMIVVRLTAAVVVWVLVIPV